MKKNNVFLAIFLSFSVLISGCANMKNTTKGGVFGGAAGAAIGTGIGLLTGNSKNAAIGAAVGTSVGATAGVLIGKKMDKQKAELEKIEGAKIESVTDINDLQAIKVTFDSGILFATGKSALSAESKIALTNFSKSLKETAETDVTIYGHTDNTGSREVNESISLERAQSVVDFLSQNSITTDRKSVV